MSTWIASPAFKTDSDGGGRGDGGGGGVHDIDIPIGFLFYGIIAIFLMVVVLMIKLLCDTEGGGGERGRGRARESSRLLSSKEEDLFISYGTSIDDDEESRNGNCSSSSDDLYDGKICVICYDDQRTCFFIPCGHCITCFTCAKRIISEENKSCPICRTCINRDFWRWTGALDDRFTTKQVYIGLMQPSAEIDESEDMEAFHLLWTSATPRRVQSSAWKVLKSRLPTRNELKKWGIISDSQDSTCPCCELEEESVPHLFFDSIFARTIWYAIYKWVGITMVAHTDPKRHLLIHYSLMGKSVETAVAIWAATVELIWRTRNEVVFGKGKFHPMKSFGEIKAKIWSWLLSNGSRNNDFSFIDWSRDPRGCVT
ncbi:hypothetical protein ACS0TY_029333 [Phlomoides rotata]